ALKEVGAVVENPELYKYLSGRENLMQIARIRKISKEEVEETIKLVGLENRIDDKVRKYSLGMKQRLGLAASLLSKPKLLILDEPTNGLDPSGILDFREVVQKAARERDMAVFVSSHILSEVQNLCDKVALNFLYLINICITQDFQLQPQLPLKPYFYPFLGHVHIF
ncbi:ATP-binding cassette domain-containing protein, partial [Clostridium saudiense]|nr:ATP-binding cassette domain-containing protein [Clostridium saudiense]